MRDNLIVFLAVSLKYFESSAIFCCFDDMEIHKKLCSAMSEAIYTLISFRYHLLV